MNDENEVRQGTPPMITNPETATTITPAEKDVLGGVPLPVESAKVKVTPKQEWGHRAVQMKFPENLRLGLSQIWGSRILILLVIVVLSCVYLGTDLMLFFNQNEIVSEVEFAKIQFALLQLGKKTDAEAPEIAPTQLVKIPMRSSGSWIGLIGHIILVILAIRGLMLVFRARDKNYLLTQF